MRKAERQTSDEEARSLLEGGLYCILSMVAPDGGAYAVPMSYAVRGDTLYVHCARGAGFKYECLTAHPRAAAVVVRDDIETIPGKFSTYYESAIARGPVRLVEDEAERQIVLNALVGKYDAPHAKQGRKYARAASPRVDVFALEIEELTGKARRRPH